MDAATARAWAPVATTAGAAGGMTTAAAALVDFAFRAAGLAALEAAGAFAGFAAAAGFTAFFAAAFTVFGFAVLVAAGLAVVDLAAAGFLATFAAVFGFAVLVAAGLAAAALRFVAVELADFAGEAVFLEATAFAADFVAGFFKLLTAFLVLVEATGFLAVLDAGEAAFALTALPLDATEDLEEVLALDATADERPVAAGFLLEALRFVGDAVVVVALVDLALVFADPAFTEFLVFAAI